MVSGWGGLASKPEESPPLTHPPTRCWSKVAGHLLSPGASFSCVTRQVWFVVDLYCKLVQEVEQLQCLDCVQGQIS